MPEITASDTTDSLEAVGRGFAIPGKGKCRAWVGFTGGDAATQDVSTSGTGCTSSDGTQLSLTYTGSNPTNGGNIFIDSVTLSLPAQTGTVHETTIAGGVLGSYSDTVTGAKCKKVPVPPAPVAVVVSRTASRALPGGMR